MKKVKKLQKLINEVQKKNKTKKTKKCTFMPIKHRMCTQKIRKSNYIAYTQKIQSYRILEYTVFFCSGQVKCC